MLDPALRRLKDRILSPVARALPGISPTWLTAAGLGLGLASAYAAWNGRFLPALAFWLANRTLDGLDGIVARLQGRVTDLGGYLDLVADFVVYASIPAALALRPGAAAALAPAAVVLLASFYVNTISWTVAAALMEKRPPHPGATRPVTSIEIPEGLISGGETILFYSLFFLMPGYQVPLFYSMAVLTALTVLQRVLWASRTFRV